MNPSHETNERNRRSYERIAGKYAGTEPREDDPALRALARGIFLREVRGRDVLEIGCGPATDTAAFHERGLAVTATDSCQAMVEIARSRVPGVAVRAMDMTRPDLPPRSFDGIYGFACFVHLPREIGEPTLRALCELLRPGGILFLSLIESTLVDEYTIEDWGAVSDNPVLFTCWSRADAVALFESAGFVDVVTFDLPSTLYEKLPRLVERGVGIYGILGRNPV